MGFHDDAIKLSGETGTKLKCQILGAYYPQWWNITSGGRRHAFQYPTAIVEMNSGTGLDYIEDTKETILGSSGHAMFLKNNPAIDSSNLKVILVEEDPECFSHLRNVVRRNWPSLDLTKATGEIESNDTGVFLFQKSQREALDLIDRLKLGNSLFFFDPLLFPKWEELDRAAFRRIKTYYKTGTEFIIFIFTTDWFMGRDSLKLDPLPIYNDESKWTPGEASTVARMDEMFGNKSWRSEILNNSPIKERTEQLVSCYRKRLHKWFRYVLPMPFNPKGDQLYHLFMCSNYETGVRLTRGFYQRYSNNPPYAPDSGAMFAKFLRHDRYLIQPISKGEKALIWRMLRDIIRQHDEGLCDFYCKDFKSLAVFEWQQIQLCLEALRGAKYLAQIDQMTDVWENLPRLYKLDWTVVKDKLGVDAPPPFRPLTAELLKQYKELGIDEGPSRSHGRRAKPDPGSTDLTKWFNPGV